MEYVSTTLVHTSHPIWKGGPNLAVNPLSFKIMTWSFACRVIFSGIFDFCNKNFLVQGVTKILSLQFPLHFWIQLLNIFGSWWWSTVQCNLCLPVHWQDFSVPVSDQQCTITIHLASFDTDSLILSEQLSTSFKYSCIFMSFEWVFNEFLTEKCIFPEEFTCFWPDVRSFLPQSERVIWKIDQMFVWEMFETATIKVIFYGQCLCPSYFWCHLCMKKCIYVGTKCF